jgi:hypothetical protein
VRIELAAGTLATATVPDGVLMLPGRQRGIPLYLPPKQ